MTAKKTRTRKKPADLPEKDKLLKAKKWLKTKLNGFVPLIVVTAGSGLGYLADLLERGGYCEFSEIPYCPVAGATGHAGRLYWGYLAGVPIVVLKGRVHLYEGFTINAVVFLTRLLILVGKEKIYFILTHATGAVTRNLEPGDIVAIRSHIASDCDPTAGPDALALGTEFQPMGEAYSRRLLQVAKECALGVGVSLHWGVSFFKHGRTYETEAEGEMMRRAGADVATMSTIPEVIAATQMGAKRDAKNPHPLGVTAVVQVLDLALVTDMVDGLRGTSAPLSHQEVQDVAEAMKGVFGDLVTAVVTKIAHLE